MCLVEATTATTTFAILGDFSSKFPTICRCLVPPQTDVSCIRREDLKAGIYREDGLGDGGGAESSLPISDHQPPCLTSLQRRGSQSILCECRRAVATTCPDITSIIITTCINLLSVSNLAKLATTIRSARNSNCQRKVIVPNFHLP